MQFKLTVFLFLVIIYQCNGHIPILGNILSTAHEQIKSGVDGVAGAVLGGINLNFFGLNRQNRPQEEPQKGSEETIIVVVEEPGHSDYGPPNPNYHGPTHNRPPPHHHHYQRPPLGFDSSPPQPPPPHHHQTPLGPRPEYYGQNQGAAHNVYGNNQNFGNQENDMYLYGSNKNERPYDNNKGNSDNHGYEPNDKGAEEHQENDNNNNGAHMNQFYNNPTTVKTSDSTKSSTSTTNDDSNKEKENTTHDLPLFIPLGPNDYVYGGDKINITAPKRDTEKTKPLESDDDDFSIDIRLKDA